MGSPWGRLAGEPLAGAPGIEPGDGGIKKARRPVPINDHSHNSRSVRTTAGQWLIRGVGTIRPNGTMFSLVSGVGANPRRRGLDMGDTYSRASEAEADREQQRALHSALGYGIGHCSGMIATREPLLVSAARSTPRAMARTGSSTFAAIRLVIGQQPKRASPSVV